LNKAAWAFSNVRAYVIVYLQHAPNAAESHRMSTLCSTKCGENAILVALTKLTASENKPHLVGRLIRLLFTNLNEGQRFSIRTLFCPKHSNLKTIAFHQNFSMDVSWEVVQKTALGAIFIPSQLYCSIVLWTALKPNYVSSLTVQTAQKPVWTPKPK